MSRENFYIVHFPLLHGAEKILEKTRNMKLWFVEMTKIILVLRGLEIGIEI